ncbi:hypothetical protein FM120_03885 [Sphingobacterium faecium PCAi_F2.5]|nr:hypothetical protein FM120_03885 [Sphingobacterium faecium PCAi_F2.5]
MHRYAVPFLYILPNRLRHSFHGIFIIPFVVFGNDFFSFHICDQRKEAKERRLIRNNTLKAIYHTIPFFL